MSTQRVTPAMMRRRRRISLLVVLTIVVVVAFIVSRCGGDGESNNAADAVPTVDAEATPTATPDPEPGPEGIVSQLQADLTDLEFYTGPITGEYDESTVAAVKAFQEFAGLPADGVYGSETAAAIDVALGRSGGSAALQSALASTCYYDGEIDGIYGPGTELAVRDLQADAGIGVDGLYGPETARALVAIWPTRPISCEETPSG